MYWLLYIILLIILTTLGDYNTKGNHSTSIICRGLLVIVLSLVSGIGSPSAEDHEGYAYFFKISSWSDLSFNMVDGARTGIETSYFILSAIAKSLHIGECGFFLLLAVFINTAIVHFIYKYNHPVLAILLLFGTGLLLQQQNLLRQFVATGIFLYSMKYLYQSDWKKYTLSIFASTFFHTAAVVLLIFLPLCFIKKKNSIKYYNWTLAAVWVFSLLVAVGLVRIDFLNYLGIFTYYADYMNTENAIGMQISFLHVLLTGFLALAAFVYTKKYDLVLSNTLIIASIVLNLAVGFPNLQRFYFFFYVVEWVYVAHFSSLQSYAKIDDRYLGSRVSKPNALTVKALYLFFVIYCIYLLATGYIINNNVGLMSKTYNLTNLIY